MKLTVDAIVTIASEKILMIERAKEPFMDKLVLPGGHVEAEDIDLRHACARELAEEVGLVVDPSALRLVTLLDGADRDPRPLRRVSAVFHIDLPSADSLIDCEPASDAKALRVVNVLDLTKEEVGFDHWLAIKEVIGEGD